MLRDFAGFEIGKDSLPDGTTILRFRHLLEKHDLARTLDLPGVTLRCEP